VGGIISCKVGSVLGSMRRTEGPPVVFLAVCFVPVCLTLEPAFAPELDLGPMVKCYILNNNRSEARVAVRVW
jgi:hypothetical protein